MRPNIDLILITNDILVNIEDEYNISEIYQIWYNNFDELNNTYSCVFIYYRENKVVYSYFNFDANINRWIYIKDTDYSKLNKRDSTLLYENYSIDSFKILIDIKLVEYAKVLYLLGLYIFYFLLFIIFMIILNIILYAYYKNIYIPLYSLLFIILLVVFLYFYNF